MDKFLLLVRRYLSSLLCYLVARDWVEDEVRRYIHILKGTPLQYVVYGRIEEDELLIPSRSQPPGVKIPNGLHYHLIDIYLDELEKIFPLEPEGASHKLPIGLLLESFKQLLGKSPAKVVRVKSKEMLQDNRLGDWGYSNTNRASDREADVSAQIVTSAGTPPSVWGSAALGLPGSTVRECVIIPRITESYNPSHGSYLGECTAPLILHGGITLPSRASLWRYLSFIALG